MWAKSKQTGFTIVELLIVIVVIGILAAITIVAYNGVQNRARDTVAASDLSSNAKKMQTGHAINSRFPTTVEANGNTDYKIKLSNDSYRFVTYCVSDNNFAIAAEVTTGNKYYVKGNGPITQDNALNILSPCAGLGITNTSGTAADKIYIGMNTTSCAGEGGTCTFTGSATVAYGSLAQGKFNALANQVSPLTCSNTTFGDPASGFTKACYILSN